MDENSGFLPRLWKRVMLRSVHFSDSHRRLDLLYKLPDPWGMETRREQHRFGETNAFLMRHLGPVDRLLEVGCGEGHQTLFLRRIARVVVGLDVSSTAIERARARAPEVAFVAGDLFNLPDAVGPRRFDVVTACEVLYYVRDVPGYVRMLERLGRRVVATYVDKHRDALDPILLSKPGVIAERIRFEDIGWTIAMWRGDAEQAVRPNESDPSRDRLG